MVQSVVMCLQPPLGRSYVSLSVSTKPYSRLCESQITARTTGRLLGGESVSQCVCVFHSFINSDPCKYLLAMHVFTVSVGDRFMVIEEDKITSLFFF